MKYQNKTHSILYSLVNYTAEIICILENKEGRGNIQRQNKYPLSLSWSKLLPEKNWFLREKADVGHVV